MNVLNMTSTMTMVKSNTSIGMTIEDQMDILKVRVIVYGFLLFPLAVIGVILNSFTILVLLHPRLRPFSTNAYLTALSLANIVCLANFIFLYSLRYTLSYKVFQIQILQINNNSEVSQFESFINLVYGVWSPIFTTFQLYTFYLTCAVTVDRWIYVTWPLKADKICTLRNTFITIGAIFLFCFIYNLPRWFEIESDKVTLPSTNQTYYQARMTEFGKTPMFNAIMRRYGYFIFVYGLPFVVLVIVNIGIAQKLIEAKRRKKRLLGPQKKSITMNGTKPLLKPNQQTKPVPTKTSDEIVEIDQDKLPDIKSVSPKPNMSRRFSRAIASTVTVKKNSIKIDTRITFMVITVVVAFFLCQFPYLIVNLLAVSNMGKKWFHLSKVVCDFLAALNCCINFIIYCMFGQKFREIAKGILLHPSFSPYNNTKTLKAQQLELRRQTIQNKNTV